MRIVNLLINEELVRAELDLEKATADNLVDLSKAYLGRLEMYRDELHKLGGIPEIAFAQQTRLGRELIDQSRKAIRSAIEVTASERNRVESLVDSLTLINLWDAAATFNKLKHRDSTEWEVKGSAVRITSNDEQMNVEEAVETAAQLRREVYIRDRFIFNRSDRQKPPTNFA